MPDYAPKVLRVVLCLTTNKDKGKIEGMVYDADKMFSEARESVKREYLKFYSLNLAYRLISVKTEMGPGELAQVFGQKFNAECRSWVGGMIAPFTIDPTDADALWEDVTTHPETYLDSAQKKIYA